LHQKAKDFLCFFLAHDPMPCPYIKHHFKRIELSVYQHNSAKQSRRKTREEKASMKIFVKKIFIFQ